MKFAFFIIFLIIFVPAFAQEPSLDDQLLSSEEYHKIVDRLYDLENKQEDQTNYAIIGLTIVLVGATIFYAVQTFRTVSVLKETREAEFLPHIVPSLSMLGPVAIVLEVFNIGKGGAKNLEVKYRMREIPDSEKIWYQSLFNAGESQVFYLKGNSNELAIDLKFFEEKQITIEVDASYWDIFDNPHSSSTTIDATKFVTQFKTVSAKYKEKDTDATQRSLKQIAEGINKVPTDMRRLQDDISAQWNANRIDYQISITLKKIEDLKIKSKKQKRKIELLLYDLAIILREKHVSLYQNEVRKKLNEIQSLNQKAFQIVKDTMLILKFIVKFDEKK